MCAFLSPPTFERALSIIIVKQCRFRISFLILRFCPHLLLSIVNHHCQTMPFQDFLSHFDFCPHLLLSIVNHHCQTMPFQDFLSHVAFLSPPIINVNHHCQTMSFQDFLSHFAFLSPPSLSNNALSGFPFSFCVSVHTIPPPQKGEV